MPGYSREDDRSISVPVKDQIVFFFPLMEIFLILVSALEVICHVFMLKYVLLVYI